MHWIDWLVLSSVLIAIVGYGIYKTRKITTAEGFLRGGGNTPWWLVGISVMATQASAITFLSTPGQAFDDGMRFVQFYFGLPIAMVLLCAFALPYFYKLKVYTAYEFLENRFDLKTRTLASVIFLLQRGLAAGITIYAPAIILSTLLPLSLTSNILIIGGLVLVYTIIGGTEAVTQTQKQQMFVIMTGMIVAFYVVVHNFPEGFTFSDSMHLAGQMGKLNLVTFDMDWSDRYNIWTALFAGTFLFLAYFGTDQSQVQRYLNAKSLKESRMGLLFNGLVKIPMQFFILLTGIMVFVFFQFTTTPPHFNPETKEALTSSELRQDYLQLQAQHSVNYIERKDEIAAWQVARKSGNEAEADEHMVAIRGMQDQAQQVRKSVRGVIDQYNESRPALAHIERNDKDYVFIYFILNYLPVGLIGLLLAVIFSASMSSTSAELNALATISVVDIYKRSFHPEISEQNFYKASRGFTFLWGVLAILFALSASLFENLIQAVNILGSIFYGTVLGIFLVAFFMKKISANAVFPAAIIIQLGVMLVFWLDFNESISIAYLWLNALGCLGVLILSWLFEQFQVTRKSEGKANY